MQVETQTKANPIHYSRNRLDLVGSEIAASEKMGLLAAITLVV
jgi:hypothetical protein